MKQGFIFKISKQVGQGYNFQTKTMHIAITTQAQVAELNQGDIIIQYHTSGKPLPEIFDKKNSAAYTINAINAPRLMFELIRVEDPLIVWLSPGRLGRMFIRSANLTLEGNWWLQ